jgi:hypothetical protein
LPGPTRKTPPNSQDQNFNWITKRKSHMMGHGKQPPFSPLHDALDQLTQKANS